MVKHWLSLPSCPCGGRFLWAFDWGAKATCYKCGATPEEVLLLADAVPFPLHTEEAEILVGA